MKQNCLGHALDKWTGKGGYMLIARASSHPWFKRYPRWVLQHVMHLDDAKQLSSYVPEKDLGHPMQALFGFDAVVRDYDPEPAPPMPVRGIVIGVALLAISVWAWAIKHWWRRVWS